MFLLSAVWSLMSITIIITILYHFHSVFCCLLNFKLDRLMRNSKCISLLYLSWFITYTNLIDIAYGMLNLHCVINGAKYLSILWIMRPIDDKGIMGTPWTIQLLQRKKIGQMLTGQPTSFFWALRPFQIFTGFFFPNKTLFTKYCIAPRMSKLRRVFLLRVDILPLRKANVHSRKKSK